MSNPLRDRLGTELHRIVDERIAEREAQIVARVREEVRHAALHEHQVYGPSERLSLDPTAIVNDALFNTVSGTITVAAGAFFGHGVAILTGSHDVRVRGLARQGAIPRSGHDVSIGPGAWISSRATVIGPCAIGADAVVCAGAVVTADVEAETVVAGVPARAVGDLRGAIPAAADVDTPSGRAYLAAGEDGPAPSAAGLERFAELTLRADLAVDLGAGPGLASLAAARAGGERVIALESDPAARQLLRANLARHGLQATVELLPAGAGPGDVVVADQQKVVVRLAASTADGGSVCAVTAAMQHALPVLLAEFCPQALRDRGQDPLAVLGAYTALGYGRRVLEDPGLDGCSDAELVDRAASGAGLVTLQLGPSA